MHDVVAYNFARQRGWPRNVRRHIQGILSAEGSSPKNLERFLEPAFSKIFNKLLNFDATGRLHRAELRDFLLIYTLMSDLYVHHLLGREAQHLKYSFERIESVMGQFVFDTYGIGFDRMPAALRLT